MHASIKIGKKFKASEVTETKAKASKVHLLKTFEFLTSVTADRGSGDERADGPVDEVALLALALHELLDADVEASDGGEGGPVGAAHLERSDEARERDVALHPGHVVPGGDDGAPDGPRGEPRHRALHRLRQRRVLLHRFAPPVPARKVQRIKAARDSGSGEPQPSALGRRDRDLVAACVWSRWG